MPITVGDQAGMVPFRIRATVVFGHVPGPTWLCAVPHVFPSYWESLPALEGFLTSLSYLPLPVLENDHDLKRERSLRGMAIIWARRALWPVTGSLPDGSFSEVLRLFPAPTCLPCKLFPVPGPGFHSNAAAG